MATYADWSASRQDPASNVSQQYHQDGSNGSGPVKLLIDGQGNLLHSSTSSSASGRPGYAGEFTHQQAPDLAMDRMAAMEDSQHNSMMSIDDQQEIVQNIRSSHRSGAGQHHQHQSHGNAYASTNDEQRAWTSRQLPPTTILLVIDTNWLLNHLKLFRQIERLIPQIPDSFAQIVFILPSVVLKELDGLKNADSRPAMNGGQASRYTPTIANLSRTASNFILEKLTHRPDLFRGQKADEGSIQGAVEALKTNDDRILDCCAHFQKQGYQVGLLSDDKILCAQATVSGLPYMNFMPEDHDPEAFLAKLHPDLAPYFAKLRTSSSNGIATSHTVHEAPTLSLDNLANKTVQMQQGLIEQQAAAFAHLEHNFPLMPPELLEVISVVTNSLLVPIIFPILLHHMANDNVEIFAYMLKRSSIFRDFSFSSSSSSGSTGSSSDYEVLDCTRWNACICLRLIDQNWQMCFVDIAGKIQPAPSAHAPSTASSSFTFSDRNAPTPQNGASATLSQSRWASSSSSFSARRSISGSLSQNSSSSSSSTLFHPSKVSALAKAFDSPSEDILRWSSARWRLVLEDLELFLCRTSILAQHPGAKQKAEALLAAARKNVDSWKAS